MPCLYQNNLCDCATCLRGCRSSTEHQQLTNWKLSFQWLFMVKYTCTTSSKMGDQNDDFISMESYKSFFVNFLKFQMDDRWSECRKLTRNLRNGRVKISLSSGHLFILFCCPYDVLVVMDDWMTANMDPCFTRWVCTVVSLHPVTYMQQKGSH